MSTYVLVGGAWIGAWAWQDVARRLRAQGHEVYPITLTGLADRVHLGGPSTDLETHIADIVNTLVSNDLHEVVLVGHSYAGVPITGAGDRASDRIRQLVYVDAGPIPDGVALADTDPPEVQALVMQQVQEHGEGWRWPLLTFEQLEQMGSSLAGISEDGLARFRALATPHPYGTYRQALHLTRPDAEPLPKLGVLSSFSEAQLREMIAAGHPWGQSLSGPEWRFVDLPTGHWPMFSEPQRLTELLHAAGQ